MSAKETYFVTDRAGKWVAGYRLPLDATTIDLTPEEAEYDLRAGTIVPPGQPLPTRSEPAAVESADRVTLVRAGGERSASIADLVGYLVATGAVANGQAAAINAVVSSLRGTADQGHNTLGKLAAIIAGLGISDITGLGAALAEKATPADIALAVSELVAAYPAALDPNFAASITNALAGKQPLATSLTAIAALATAPFGRSLLTLPSMGAARSALGLGDVVTMSTADVIAAVRDALNGKEF